MGYFFGIGGVLLGTTVSLGLIICIWKPYFLYKEGFHLPVYSYWVKTSVFVVVSALIWIALHFLVIIHIDFQSVSNFGELIAYGLMLVPLYTLLTWGGYYVTSKGMRDFTARLKYVFFKKNK